MEADHLGTMDFTQRCSEKLLQGVKTGSDTIQYAFKHSWTGVPVVVQQVKSLIVSMRMQI